MSETELDAVRAAAREKGQTVSEWVRETLREARSTAIRAADRHGYPTADIDQMLAEIERGYGEVGE